MGCLKAKNALINRLYDSVDNISESLIDGDYKAVDKEVDNMYGQLKHLKANIKENDEIS